MLRALWTEETVRHEGEFYRLPPVHQDPRPAPPPPILLGGGAEAALRRAGRLADGWVSASREDPAGLGKKISVVKEAARDAGRDPGSLRFVTRAVTMVRPSGEPGRRLLSGSFEEIRGDLDVLAAQGVTDVFHDLNFDPGIGSPDADPGSRCAGPRPRWRPSRPERSLPADQLRQTGDGGGEIVAQLRGMRLMAVISAGSSGSRTTS
nr:hypothetical protein GCM10020093_003210 [Planobispora longispora]